MADLSCKIAGVSSPNPFWLASAPPTDKRYNVERAFEAGWGGVVWKTLGEDGPPIVNVSSRYGSVDFGGQRMMGLNNIELITDRPLQVNLDEITAVKKAWPDGCVRGTLVLAEPGPIRLWMYRDWLRLPRPERLVLILHGSELRFLMQNMRRTRRLHRLLDAADCIGAEHRPRG
jgi:hypothetical protein